MDMKAGSAMGTLGPLLRQPSSNTEIAAQLGAMGTQVSVLQFLHTDETAKNVRERLHRRVLPSGRRDVHHSVAGD